MALDQGASFDPDDHLATLVLRHVGEVRDRLALECVSRVWRRVGRITGGWGRQDLTVSGALAARLTNARFVQLLRRAGPNVRSIVVNDASASFTGTGLLHAYAALIDEVPAAGELQRLPGAPLPDQPSRRSKPWTSAAAPACQGSRSSVF